MKNTLRLLLATVALGFSAPTMAVAADLSPNDRQIYRQAFNAVKANRWEEAERIANRASNPVLAKVIHWSRLRFDATHADFADISRFIDQNPDWPNRDMLVVRAENEMTGDIPPLVLADWFERHPPQTVDARMRYAAILQAQGKTAKLGKLVRDTWINRDFSQQLERTFLQAYGDLLDEKDHIARLDHLLWTRDYAQAYRMLPRVPANHRLLAEARTAVQRSAPNVAQAVARVPASLRNDPGLVYDRIYWRRMNNEEEGAQQLLLTYTGPMPYPEKWAVEQGYHARKLLRLGQKRQAYKIAANSTHATGEPLADIEFLAGWIALRHLGQPEKALKHFQHLRQGVQFPISIARGEYWIGRAAAAAGKPGVAEQAYRAAAKHYVTFYGQLAARELGLDPVQTVSMRPALERTTAINIYHNELAQVIRQLAAIGENRRIDPFARALYAESRTPDGMLALSSLLHKIERPDLAVTLAKQAKNDGFSAPEAEFPMLRFSTMHPGTDQALALALMRQESLFNRTAMSPVGARGLMQLMPATAQKEARAAGMPFSVDRLTADPNYNVRLGTQHMVRLVNSYGGAYPLVLAAYNAGPGNVQKWLESYGDPRRGEIDMLDWIESIPFRETRNYVQRVLEGLEMYRVRLAIEEPGRAQSAAAFRDGWCSLSCPLVGLPKQQRTEAPRETEVAQRGR